MIWSSLKSRFWWNSRRWRAACRRVLSDTEKYIIFLVFLGKRRFKVLCLFNKRRISWDKSSRGTEITAVDISWYSACCVRIRVARLLIEKVWKLARRSQQSFSWWFVRLSSASVSSCPEQRRNNNNWSSQQSEVNTKHNKTKMHFWIHSWLYSNTQSADDEFQANRFTFVEQTKIYMKYF